MKDARTPNAEPRAEATPYEAHIERLVAEAPPLTEEQRGRIRALFRSRPAYRAA
jgi:hypothetical protein